MWCFHMKQLRNEQRYNLLSIKYPLSIPTRLSNKMTAFQRTFMDENKNNLLRNQWTTVNDVNSYYINDHEIHGEQISNKYGELLEDRFSGCLKCHHCLCDCGIVISMLKMSMILLCSTRLLKTLISV